MEGEGFEPSKSETTDLQSVPFGHSGTPPNCLTFSQHPEERPEAGADRVVSRYVVGIQNGAGDGNRTRNLLITNQLLYH